MSFVGSRISLKATRAIIDAIHAGTLADGPTVTDPVFGLQVVTAVPGVLAAILVPEEAWADKVAFRTAAKKLAGLFAANFAKFESGTAADVKNAGPKAA